MTVPSPLRAVRAAFVFLTRIPVGGFPYSPEDWAWSSAHFPLVGLVIGVALGALDRVLLPVGALGAAFVTLGVSMMVTGAFHEDGLADTSDALGGAYDRDKLIAILKDSRIGSFGGAALAVSVGARAALVARLGASAVWGIPLAFCAARATAVALMAALPYATVGEWAKSKQVARGRAPQALVAAAYFALAGGALVLTGHLGLARLAALAVVMVAVALATGWRYARRLGGVTGDFLGATEQIAEIAAFATLAWGSLGSAAGP